MLAAQKIQRERYRSESFHFNSQLDGRRTQKYIKLGSAEEAMIRDVFEKTDLSARGYNRVLKIARTIADLDGSPEIREIHLKEALFSDIRIFLRMGRREETDLTERGLSDMDLDLLHLWLGMFPDITNMTMGKILAYLAGCRSCGKHLTGRFREL